jgi:hypothetical protein
MLALAMVVGMDERTVSNHDAPSSRETTEGCENNPSCVNPTTSRAWTEHWVPGNGRETYGATVAGSLQPKEQWETWGRAEALYRDRTYLLHGGTDTAVTSTVNAAAMVSNPTSFHEVGAVLPQYPGVLKCLSLGSTDRADFLRSCCTVANPTSIPEFKADLQQQLHQNLVTEVEDEEESVARCCTEDGFNDNDVLCGRGEHVNRHPGNKVFHEEKERLQPQYLRAIKRKEKTAIAQQLVDTMRVKYGSRFLGYSDEKKKYVVIDNIRVLEKAKQVLRETFTPEQRKMKRERYFRPKKKMFYAQCLADLRNAKA